MYNLPEITEPIDQLEFLVRGERDAQIQRRFHMLLLLKTGGAESRSAAADHPGVHRDTVANWLELYEEGDSIKFRKLESPVPIPVNSRFPQRSSRSSKSGSPSRKGLETTRAFSSGLTKPAESNYLIRRFIGSSDTSLKQSLRPLGPAIQKTSRSNAPSNRRSRTK